MQNNSNFIQDIIIKIILNYNFFKILIPKIFPNLEQKILNLTNFKLAFLILDFLCIIDKFEACSKFDYRKLSKVSITDVGSCTIKFSPRFQWLLNYHIYKKITFSVLATREDWV